MRLAWLISLDATPSLCDVGFMENPSAIDPAIDALDERINFHFKEIERLNMAKAVLKSLNNTTVHVPTGHIRISKTAENFSENLMNLSHKVNRLSSTLNKTLDNMNNRELFIHVLKNSPSPWMSANEIQEKASELKGTEVPMSTVSPTLSSMKSLNMIVRNGFFVALPDRVDQSQLSEQSLDEPEGEQN